MDWKYLNNAEIELKLKDFELEHENVKLKILSLVDKMDEIEKQYSSGLQELKNRK